MPSDPTRDAFLRIIESRQDIDGRFTSLQRVGPSGGDGYFSLVFRATDTLSTNCDVAIKIFRPDRVDPYRLACFQREAQILQGLQGQADILNWVAPYSEFVQEFRSDAGIVLPLRLPYFAVELAETDIGAIIENGGWSVEESLQKFHVMCRAVQRIHCRHIAHRDLKPSNFLVMPDGCVKLSDFGTARKIEGSVPPVLPRYMMAPGDSRYSSPEMLALLHDDDPSWAFFGDIFALGSILFELLTGNCLGLVLDPGFRADLLQVMTAVAPGQRRRVYDQLITHVADSHPLPGLAASGARIPSGVLERLDELYASMAALDYRARLCQFDRIFLGIRTCLIILRNDQQYRRWREQKERYRRDRKEKRRRAQVRAHSPQQGNLE